MKRLIILLLLPVLLIGCMAAAPDGSPGVSPAYTEEGAMTAAPSATLNVAQSRFPWGCDCASYSSTEQRGRITIKRGNLSWDEVPHTCDGESGTAIWIDDTRVYHDEESFFKGDFYVAYNAVDGRDIAVINLSRKGGSVDWIRVLLLFDMETKEKIVVPDYEADLGNIPYDEETKLIDTDAFPTAFFAGESIPAVLPDMAVFCDDEQEYYNDSYFMPYSHITFEEDGTLNAYIRTSRTYGEAWMTYTFLDGEYQLTQVRMDNDWFYEPYEPIPGKAFEVRQRAPGDGLKPAVEMAGLELLLGGERLDYIPDEFYRAPLLVCCNTEEQSSDGLLLIVVIQDRTDRLVGERYTYMLG